jgi:hypothetical protein
MSVDPTKRGGSGGVPLEGRASAKGEMAGRGMMPMDPKAPGVQQVVSAAEVLELTAGTMPPLQTLKGKDDAATSMLEDWVGTAEVMQALMIESEGIAIGLEHFGALASAKSEKGAAERAVNQLARGVTATLAEITEPRAVREKVLAALPEVIKLLENQIKAEKKGSLKALLKKGLGADEIRGLLGRARASASEELEKVKSSIEKNEKIDLAKIGQNPLVKLFLLRETGHTRLDLYYFMDQRFASKAELISLFSQAQSLEGHDLSPAVDATISALGRGLEGTFSSEKELEEAMKAVLEDLKHVATVYNKYAKRMQVEARSALRMPTMLLTHAMQMQGRIMFKTTSGTPSNFAPRKVLELIEKGETINWALRKMIGVFAGVRLPEDTEEMISALVSAKTKPIYDEHCPSFGVEIHRKVADVIKSLIKPTLEILSGKATEENNERQLDYSMYEQTPFAAKIAARFNMMQPKPVDLPVFLTSLK